MTTICPECKQPCTAHWEDVGIGYYEYWGAPGSDVQWVCLSDCCEAQILDADLPCDRPEMDEYYD
jgi:hypothetical protein